MVAPRIFEQARTRYEWNERAQRYVDARTRRFVSGEAIRDALNEVIDIAKERIDADSLALQQGTISLAEWQTRMAQHTKQIHIVSAASARGGWAQMTPADWGATGGALKRQFAFLQNFALDIQRGVQKLGGNFIRRARMYGNAARRTYENIKRRASQAAGNTEERRVLGVADHCPDCVEFAGRGWQPIGTLPPIGDSVCKVNCRCLFEFR